MRQRIIGATGAGHLDEQRSQRRTVARHIDGRDRCVYHRERPLRHAITQRSQAPAQLTRRLDAKALRQRQCVAGQDHRRVHALQLICHIRARLLRVRRDAPHHEPQALTHHEHVRIPCARMRHTLSQDLRETQQRLHDHRQRRRRVRHKFRRHRRQEHNDRRETRSRHQRRHDLDPRLELRQQVLVLVVDPRAWIRTQQRQAHGQHILHHRDITLSQRRLHDQGQDRVLVPIDTRRVDTPKKR